MFIDLVSTDNQISCNVKAAKLLGLETAIYLNELININAKAIAKQKIDNNGYFTLKRSYITDRTTLSAKRQLELDNNLLAVEIIDKEDIDLIKVDIEMYASLLSDQSIDMKKAEKLVTKKSKTEKAEDQRKAIADNLKRSVSTTNQELREAYYGWIDAVYESPKGFLSKKSVQIFENEINNCAKGDLDVALELMKIATIKAYTNAEWVVRLYNQSKGQLRTTTSRVDDVAQLSEVLY